MPYPNLVVEHLLPLTRRLEASHNADMNERQILMAVEHDWMLRDKLEATADPGRSEHCRRKEAHDWFMSVPFHDRTTLERSLSALTVVQVLCIWRIWRERNVHPVEQGRNQTQRA